MKSAGTTTRLFLLLLGFACVAFWPSLVSPYLDIDELIWGELANSVVGGCPPYACVIGEKPPLLYMFYAGVFSLFGMSSYLATHVVHVLWVAATGLLLQTVTRVRWAGFVYILLIALPNFRNLAVTGESLMNPFMVLSWALLLRSAAKPGPADAIAMGALVGVASLFRYQAGIQLAVYRFLFLWAAREAGTGSRWRDALGRIAALALGFAVVWAITGLVLFLWGAWDDFVTWSVLYSFGYIDSGVTAPGAGPAALDNLLQVFGTTSVFWLLALFALRDRWASDRLIVSAVLYLVGAFLAASVGLRFYPHYFIQALPPLAVLAALGADRLRQPFRGRLWRAAPVVGLGLALAFLLARNAFVPYLLEHDPTKDYAPINAEIGRYLRERTDAGDRIYVWGWGHGIYYHADRRIGSRYVNSDFLSGRVPGTRASAESALRVRDHAVGSFATFFDDLEERGVVYVVDTSPAEMHDYQFFPPRNYPALASYLSEHFELEATVQGAEESPKEAGAGPALGRQAGYPPQRAGAWRLALPANTLRAHA